MFVGDQAATKLESMWFLVGLYLIFQTRKIQLDQFVESGFVIGLLALIAVRPSDSVCLPLMFASYWPPHLKITYLSFSQCRPHIQA